MDAPALQITDLAKRYPTGTEALRGVSLEISAGRVLRPARAQRRRQVDADPLHDRPGDARPRGSIRVFGHDAIEHYEEARLAVGLAPQDLNLDWFLTVEETLDYHGGYFGMPRSERRERTAELLDDLLADRQARRPHAHAVGRHEAAADPRPRADAPAAAADPRRADRRRRRRAAPGAVALRAAHQRRGHDDPAHHALPRRGRAALRPHRLHQRRPDRRAGHERRAGGAVRRVQPRGRVPRAGRAQGALAGARSKRRTRREPIADPLLLAPAARGQPLPEDQAPDGRRAAAGDLPLHLRLRRRARLAHRQAARVRLRRLHRPRADHDGLGDQRVLEQLVLDPAAEVPARDRRPALLARLADPSCCSRSRSAASCAA